MVLYDSIGIPNMGKKPKFESRLANQWKAVMPSTGAIAAKGVAEMVSGKAPDEIKSNFSKIIVELDHVCHELYRHAEETHGEKVVRAYIEEGSSEVGLFHELNKFFLSISQGRKSRAGSSFEIYLKEMLKHCGYPFEFQPKGIDGKPDFVLPSKKHYLLNPPDCIVLTAKRTVRERWRQITTEGSRGKKAMFLSTLDDAVKPSDISEMMDNGVYLVVPCNQKVSIPSYSKASNVISYEKLFMDYFDPAVVRWRNNGIIPPLL